MPNSAVPLVNIEGLNLYFGNGPEANHALRDVSFSIQENETVAVVGESGSGKSVTALALTRLLAEPPARIASGKIEFEGKNVLGMGKEDLRKLRGKQIAYIFQEPGSSLNPVMTIGYQIQEALELHRPEVKDKEKEIVKVLDQVGIRDPKLRVNDYPHQLSGGMQQRVMIAMALACQPKLLVADEPTTALDVTIQKQIMNLLQQIRQDRKMSILLITHNFGLVCGFADRVVVMFRGQVVESGPTDTVLRNPQHRYTQALIACVPRIGQKQDRLKVIEYSGLA